MYQMHVMSLIYTSVERKLSFLFFILIYKFISIFKFSEYPQAHDVDDFQKDFAILEKIICLLFLKT